MCTFCPGALIAWIEGRLLDGCYPVGDRFPSFEVPGDDLEVAGHY